jgi:hypothetical protein
MRHSFRDAEGAASAGTVEVLRIAGPCHEVNRRGDGVAADPFETIRRQPASSATGFPIAGGIDHRGEP